MVLRHWPTCAVGRCCWIKKPLDAMISWPSSLYDLCIKTTMISYLEIHLFSSNFLAHFINLWTHKNISIFYSSYLLSPSNKTQTNMLLQTNRIKKCGNKLFLQPEIQKTVVLAMVDLHQIFIYISEGTLVVILIRYTPCKNNTN